MTKWPSKDTCTQHRSSLFKPAKHFVGSPRTSKRKLTSHHALASLAHLVSTEKVWPVLQVHIPRSTPLEPKDFREDSRKISLSFSAKLLRHLLLGPNQKQIDSPLTSPPVLFRDWFTTEGFLRVHWKRSLITSASLPHLDGTENVAIDGSKLKSNLVHTPLELDYCVRKP